jgi:hypothetical protein
MKTETAQQYFQFHSRSFFHAGALGVLGLSEGLMIWLVYDGKRWEDLFDVYEVKGVRVSLGLI